MGMKQAIVIGAGVGGLAAAIRLARQYRVTVLEAAPQPGGKLSEFRQDGYRFDMGPSLLTLPELIDELFHLHGRNPRDCLRYRPLEQVCRYQWEDGTIVHGWKDPHRFARELAEQTDVTEAQVLQFLSRSRKKYELTRELFLQRSLHKVRSYLSRHTLRALLGLPKLDLLHTMHGANRSTFSDPRVVQLFDRFATYNGSSPYRAPATLNLIPHLEHHLGAWFPEGGMYRRSADQARTGGWGRVPL